MHAGEDPAVWGRRIGRITAENGMAEREGFEPSIGVTYTPLAGERLQPLGHLSRMGLL